ncbi:DUF3916 domain-containing protein [Pseudobacillus wudalianchiensis]|uniref:Group-specific protein n=1 Tax=Pseudobacillus wudalianchiensis TaxID=1743143 RepID=A0A1B9AME1_9BACI|nr:DUF3916 domain-containing protein [Bacillus wudalianchiensis]OCA85077.1 group-specific protein [Bacillus wudalianchiensis]
MSDKKIRGLKRKTKKMIERIEQETETFPSEFYNGYWHLHIPAAQSFISSSKIPLSIKRACMQTLLDRTEHLIKIKPQYNEKLRVVAAIDLPDLWNSQIIVFTGDRHFKGFFDRDDGEQRWTPLSKKRDIEKEWSLSIPAGVETLGIREDLTEEDGEKFESEIWFVGELK